MPTKGTSTKKPAPVKPEPAINDHDMDFHAGELTEQDRIKKLMDERYKTLVDMFNNELNIATRYELKLRIDELQETYKELFME